MRKVLVGSTILLIVIGAAILSPPVQNLFKSKQASSFAVASKPVSKPIPPRDPNSHDFSDVDYAQKKLIHHQLGALIADKAKTDAVLPEVRQIAEQVSIQETERANVYASLLTSWNESYLNITDFPETGGCNGYPTFSGMLPHVEVGSYRLSSGKNVDEKFFTLLIEHHQKADDLVTLEGSKIGFGKLIDLQKASQQEYKAEIIKFAGLQKSLL